jgi:DNA-directed RNA polymerase subunit RPC12/RpoP
MTTLRNKCQKCGKEVEFPKDDVGKVRTCPFCDKETLLVRPMTAGRFIGEAFLFIVSAPVGLLYVVYLVTLPFTTYSFSAFLDSTAVGSLYLFSLGAPFIVNRTYQHESRLMRASLSVWWSIFAGILGVVIAIVCQFLFYWPIWLVQKMFS